MASWTRLVVTMSIIPRSSSWRVGREHDVFLDHHVEAVARPHLDGGLDVEVLLKGLTHHVAKGRGYVVHAGLAEGERDVADAGVAGCRDGVLARRAHKADEKGRAVDTQLVIVDPNGEAAISSLAGARHGPKMQGRAIG